RRHTRFSRDWSSDVCSSDLASSVFSDFSGYHSVRKKSQKTEDADLSPIAENGTDETINTIAVVDDNRSLKTSDADIQEQETKAEDAATDMTMVSEDAILESMLSFVDQREQILTQEQEAEIEKALEATQKVLTEVQWKALEKSIADAFSSAEKELVRQQLAQEAEKANWEKMEARLRQAYAQI